MLLKLILLCCSKEIRSENTDRKTKRETTKNQQLLEVTFYVTTDLTEIEETK